MGARVLLSTTEKPVKMRRVIAASETIVVLWPALQWRREETFVAEFECYHVLFFDEYH